MERRIIAIHYFTVVPDLIGNPTNQPTENFEGLTRFTGKQAGQSDSLPALTTDLDTTVRLFYRSPPVDLREQDYKRSRERLTISPVNQSEFVVQVFNKIG